MRFCMFIPSEQVTDPITGETGDQGTEALESETGEGVSGDTPPQSIKIGEKEYSTEELRGLLEKAGQYDSLQPEYTKVTQRLADVEREEKKKMDEQSKTVEQKELDTAADRAFTILESRIVDVVKKVLGKESQGRDLGNRMTELEKEIDGEDGRPAFVIKDIAKYAEDNELGGDPLDIYEKKFRNELRDFYRKQGVKPKPTFSEKTGSGVHLPKGKDLKNVSREDFNKAAVEFLGALGE